LTNILRNAVDAIENDGTITIKASVMDEHLAVAIRDTGSGISEQKINDIFEPFYTTKDMNSGCGLGLTIACEIIKSYEGKIDIDSQPDQGTTFTIQIPLSKDT
jgi:two-component system NtrC family sensor kinase